VVEETIVEQMKLGDVVIEAKRLGIWTYVATVSATGRPYVTPVHPGWEGETLWIMIELASVKAKNVAANPQVSCHWPVSEDTDMDSLMLWETGRIYDDIEGSLDRSRSPKPGRDYKFIASNPRSISRKRSVASSRM
jgi:hypothetical protein